MNACLILCGKASRQQNVLGHHTKVGKLTEYHSLIILISIIATRESSVKKWD